MALVYAFAYPEAGGPQDRVIVVDSVSGAEKGAFTETGLQMK